MFYHPNKFINLNKNFNLGVYMFWQKEIETMEVSKLRKFQLDCINKQIRIAKKSEFLWSFSRNCIHLQTYKALKGLREILTSCLK